MGRKRRTEPNTARCTLGRGETEASHGAAATPPGSLLRVPPAKRILLIEDDVRIGASLTRARESSGYDTAWCRTATEGEDAFGRARSAGPGFDLVLLDLGLPDGDGLDVCRTISLADPFVPIVMLTARDEELDLVVGLDAGAVDYVTKPFSLAPLLARLRAHLRRMEVTPAPAGGRGDVITAGYVRIECRARRVSVRGSEVSLRAKEFDLLARLALEPGAVVARETLMCDVWDEHWFGSTKTLDFHIAALRSKLDGDTGAPSVISTIRGVGFRLEP